MREAYRRKKETKSCSSYSIKAVGVASVVLSLLGVAPVETNVMLLGIGVFALGVVALDQETDWRSAYRKPHRLHCRGWSPEEVKPPPLGV